MPESFDAVPGHHSRIEFLSPDPEQVKLFEARRSSRHHCRDSMAFIAEMPLVFYAIVFAM